MNQISPGIARIDVLIPAFNAQATLVSAIDSIRQQSLNDIRIIVVNDGSTDDTPQILDRIAAADPRVLPVHRQNGGIVDALNAGLALCSADYVARHDSDDLAFPERFQLQFDYLAARADCVAVGGNAWHIDETGARSGTRTHFGGDVAPDSQAVPSREPYILHPFLMVRRRALQEAGGYRHALHAEDTDLYWRLLSRGRLHNLAAMLGEYRHHSASVSSASIVNGRISAVHSQLAALSYRRRSAGKPDIDFPPGMLREFQNARSLQQIIGLAAARLDPGEANYLEVATAARLVQSAGYRPYLLEHEDCRFFTSALRRQHGMVPASSRDALRHFALVCARKLLKAGRFREAASLANPLDVAQVLAGKLRRRFAAAAG